MELYIPADASFWRNRLFAAMKSAAGADSANFWRVGYEWQYGGLPGAPAGFGVVGSISRDVMYQIIVAGGGDGFAWFQPKSGS